MKKKAKLLAWKAVSSVTILALVALAGWGVNAYTGGSASVVIENVESLSLETSSAELGVSEQVLGSANNPSTFTYGEFENVLDVSGLEMDVRNGALADATTTIFAVQNPFDVTSTVDLAAVDITGVSTSTITVSVGTSTVASPSSLSGGSLINNVEVATSTQAYLVNGATAGSDSSMTVDANSQSRITVAPDEYIVGLVGGSDTTGVTGAANTFDGDYLVRFLKIKR